MTSLLKVNRADEAVRLVGQMLATTPDDPELHCLLAQAMIAAGRPADALRAAERAAVLAPDSDWPQRLRAIALGDLRRTGEAVDAAREAVRLRPDTHMGHLILGDALLNDGRVEEAGQAAGRAAALAPDSFTVHNLLGRIALQQRRLEDAEGWFRRALALEPQNAMLHNNLGVALGAQGKSRESIDAYAEAARLDPRFDRARTNLKAQTARFVGVAGLGAVGLVIVGVVRVLALQGSHLQDWANGLPGGAQALLAAGCVALVAILAVAGFLLDRRVRRKLQTLDRKVQEFYRSERDRERLRNLRSLPFYLGGMVVTWGLMVALLVFARSWWGIGGAALLIWVLGGRAVWFRWVEPWWERVRPAAARLR